MSEILKPQQLREMQMRIGPDTTQAQLDREYIKFLEAKNERLEKLCREASEWIARYRLQSACLINAQALLNQVLQRQSPHRPDLS